MPHERRHVPDGYERPTTEDRVAMNNKKDQPDLFPKPARQPAPPAMYDVPAGTISTRCSAHKRGGTCAAEVYWISYNRPAVKGSVTVRQPIDCSGAGGFPPTATQKGRGVSHYTTCPDRDLFKK
jgi:hypothetical protein